MILGQLRGPIAKDAMGTFALRVVQTGLRFAISLLLARLLGAEGYGAYSFALACIAVLSVPALLGFDGLLLREVASYQAQSKSALLHGILRRARQLTALASLVLLLAAAGFTWALSAQFERPMLMALWIGLLVLPILTQVRVIQAALIGLRRVMMAQVPDAVVQPVLFLALIGAFAVPREVSLDAAFVIALYGASALAAWVLATRFLGRARRALEPPHALEYRTAAWLRAGLPFALTGGLNVLGASLGVLMLGFMRGPAETGIFGVAAAAAGLVSLPLMAINTPLAPAVSAAYAEGNTAELQRLATKAARGAFFMCIPLALIYVTLGHWVLRLFGEEFTAGLTALVIMTVSQVFNAAMGSLGLLLQMTSHERDVAVGLGIAVAVNLAVNLALIPAWGLEGAALGVAANVVLWNTTLLVQVRRRLAIRPTAIG